MEFPCPEKNKITIYSKSGCINCNRVKTLLKEKNVLFDIIDCDDFILDNRDEFLAFIKEMAGKEYKTFPMVFDGNKFIGGYTETIPYLDKMLDFDISF